MKKLTQNEFDAIKRDESGYIQIPGHTDCTEVDFRGLDDLHFGCFCDLGNNKKLGKLCIIGDNCRLGDGCVLSDSCVLGYGCIVGGGCTLGRMCIIKDFCNVRASFECGYVKNGLYVTIGNIGSDHRTAYFFIDEHGALFVRAGCWSSDMDNFKLRVKRVYGGTVYEAQYMAACQYAETVLPVMLAQDDARKGEGYSWH